MWFWEVIWIGPYGQLHSMYSRRGYKTEDQAQQVLLSICDYIDKRIKDEGGELRDVQIVYFSKRRLDNSGQLLN